MESGAREEDHSRDGDPERFRSCHGGAKSWSNGGSFSILIAVSEL